MSRGALASSERKGMTRCSDDSGGVAGVAVVGRVWVQAGPVEVDDEVLAPGVVGDVSFFVASG